MAIDDNSRRFASDVQRDLTKRFTKAGLYFTSKLRGYVNTAQPYTKTAGGRYHGRNPSAPGQFPHKLSGQLSRSLTWELDKKKFVLTCGSNLGGHPKFLQTGTTFMKPRPWLSLGFEKERGDIIKILVGK